MFVASSDWIDRSTETIYQAMRDAQCGRNSCVEAACIAVGVAQAFGYLCEPVPVAVCVRAGDQATVLPGPDSRRRDGFAGHLVVHYPGADTVVDLTADQFHAPRRGIWVPEPLIMPVSRDGLARGFGAELPTGTLIEYREMVDDVSWRSLPAWTESSNILIAVIVRRLRALLASSPTSSGGKRPGSTLTNRLR